MIAAGIDLGGTKSEIRLYDANWQVAARQRADTPADYPALVEMLAAQVAWADAQAGQAMPLGLAAPGRIGADGRLVAANLAAAGQDLAGDVARATSRAVHFLNDGQAFALAEAQLGAGRGAAVMLAMILGTGIGGAAVFNGKLPDGAGPVFGEFGHSPLSARVVKAHGLPLLRCGCGQRGCVETLGSGRGMARLAQHLIGEAWTSHQIGERRASDDRAAKVWQVWLEIVADLALVLTQATGATRIVLGGGLSQMPGMTDGMRSAMAAVQLPGFDVPEIVLAAGGDASGACGAAWAAKEKTDE